MNVKAWFAGLTVLLMSTVAQASIFTWKGDSKKVSDVVVADEVVAQSSAGEVRALRLGAGLREKPTLVGMVKVYVAELMASAPEKFKRTDDQALTSLDESTMTVLRMNFVRAVDADKISSAFYDGIVKNSDRFTAVGLSQNSGPLKKFLDMVAENGEVAKGQTLIVAVEQLQDRSIIYFEDAAGTTYRFDAPAGISKAMFSLWIGNPADEGVQAMKEQILAGE